MGIDGNDPGTDVDCDSACPSAHAIGDDRAAHRHEVGKVEHYASYCCRFPDDVATNWSRPGDAPDPRQRYRRIGHSDHRRKLGAMPCLEEVVQFELSADSTAHDNPRLGR